jgi:hypothetical protein
MMIVGGRPVTRTLYTCTYPAYYIPLFGLAAASLRQGGARVPLDNSELKKFAVGSKSMNVNFLTSIKAEK